MKIYFGIANAGGNPTDFTDRRELFLMAFSIKIDGLLFYVESESAFSLAQQGAGNFRLSVIRKDVSAPLDNPTPVVIAQMNWKPILIGAGVVAGLLLLFRKKG